jgi:RNA polymerase sigma factor (sigma-70 family)
MRDSEVVAAIVAGDPEGLAAAYDKYAASLYTYCRSLLREPADAADAVQDTFLIAASRLAGLRDRERLRPWLYAVARNECRRKIRARAAIATLEEASEMTDETANIGGGAERAELRALLRDAVRGLNPAEQEVIELQLRQGLDATEIADVLGVSRNHAHALISRARDQLEICLGVLLVARSGRHACADLDAMLENWDGQLTILLRKRLNRHIERCPVCTDRRRRALAPAMLLGLAPMAALPLAGAAPSGLRDQVLRLASSTRPDAVAHRASVAGRTAAFGQHGFPRPLDPPRVHWWHGHVVHIGAAVATAAAVSVAIVAVTGGGGAAHVAAAGGISATATVVPGGGASSTSPSGRSSSSAGTGQPSQATQASPGVQPTLGIQPSAPVGASSPSTAAASKSPSSSSSSPAASASSSAPAATTTTEPASASPSASPGIAVVSPTTVVLSLLAATKLTIDADGGPVSWSISEPSSLLGKVNVSPMSGTLQAGQDATVSITVSGLASVDSTLTVNPGGHVVTIVLGVL